MTDVQQLWGKTVPGDPATTIRPSTTCWTPRRRPPSWRTAPRPLARHVSATMNRSADSWPSLLSWPCDLGKCSGIQQVAPGGRLQQASSFGRRNLALLPIPSALPLWAAR